MIVAACPNDGQLIPLPDNWTGCVHCPFCQTECHVMPFGEDEWLVATSPYSMIVFLLGKSSKRKLRLAACGFCRRLWHMLKDQRSKDAIEIAEQYSDGLIGETALTAAHRGAMAATDEASPNWEFAIPGGAIRYATSSYDPVPYDVFEAAESVCYATKIPAGIMVLQNVLIRACYFKTFSATLFGPLP